MKIVQDEIFGPVVTIHKFSDEKDVIRQANDTTYGLAAGIHTKDYETGCPRHEQAQGRHHLGQHVQLCALEFAVWVSLSL